MMFDQITAHWTPYPYAIAREIFEPATYAALVAAWPDVSTFRYTGTGYHKWSLSETNHGPAYRAVLAASPAWRAVFTEIKSPAFIARVLAALAHVGLPMPADPYTARFEFSALPAAGGRIDPHTDTAHKRVTLVVPIYAADEWDPAWGGGTDLLTLLGDPGAYPENGWGTRDYMIPLKEFRVDATAPYLPNQALLFVRSDVSWHSVGPFTGPESGPWRKTLTINIERPR